MNIKEILQKKELSYKWKNISPIKAKIDTFLAHKIETKNISIENCIKIGNKGEIGDELSKELYDTLMAMKPWRKGPFELFGTLVDTEWNSYIKYNLLEPYLDVENKNVLDIGCNNGYYLFRLLDKKPRTLIGLDPSVFYKMQFDFLNYFIKSDIRVELLGIEDCVNFVQHEKIKIDTILCLGVLYHRSDPIGSLKLLHKALGAKGVLILDCFIIDGEDEVCLTPKSTYSKIPNIYFIPTINALKNWLRRAHFKDVEILHTIQTTTKEQRKTKWIDAQSLDDFVDEKTNLTAEGYPRPKRCYILAKNF